MKCLVVLCLVSANTVGFSQLVINEIMASNVSSLVDEDGAHSDWVELYNSTAYAISLSNYQLSDNENNLNKWNFPDTTIQPNSFLIVFASGKDRALSGSELHTNFSIRSEGETLFLGQNETIIHTFPATNLNANQSAGLFPDAGNNANRFNSATPGFSNSQSTAIVEIYFSHLGGYYDSSFYLEMNTEGAIGTLHYTTDGSTPGPNDFAYTSALLVSNDLISDANIYQIQISPPDFYYPTNPASVPKIVVIRAAFFDVNGIQLSEVITQSYFIKELGFEIPTLPIVSICGDSHDFFDFDEGILVPGQFFNANESDWTGNYYQRGLEWERKVNIEFYENQQNHLNQVCGIRTHGGNSRRIPQKGLKFYARSEYSKSNFNHPVFPEKNIESYKRLALKPFSSSWSQAGIEDDIASDLARNLNVDYAASRPVAVYLNGEYWGVYRIQEKIDAHFIENNYAVDPDCVDMIASWNGSVTAGSNEDYYALYEFMQNNDLSIEGNYQYIEDKIDIDNFIDYQLFEIFIANTDWPANNMKFWKSACFDNKWRWIFYDGDAGMSNFEFDGYANALSLSEEDYPTNAISTMFLRKLLENGLFYELFFERLNYLLNHQLSSQSTNVYFEQTIDTINEEMPRQAKRFEIPKNQEHWLQQTGLVDDFLLLRSCELAHQTEKSFGDDFSINDCSMECNEISNFSVYPNPSNGPVHISFVSNRSSVVEINVIDLFGRTIIKDFSVINEGYNEIDIGQRLMQISGFYFIEIVTNACNYTCKGVMNQ